ncbi:hypothetical protein KIW84_063836 [Lathyrus oleraceus]|uniref:Protein kinase domain-containing protein n=1 Tax=Pisum sativum TaxID=3888 RepID=A0A9D5A7U0_PEA|nr:hypothetical protein KIW84_063836 [Pisum sativum]
MILIDHNAKEVGFQLSSHSALWPSPVHAVERMSSFRTETMLDTTAMALSAIVIASTIIHWERLFPRLPSNPHVCMICRTVVAAGEVASCLSYAFLLAAEVHPFLTTIRKSLSGRVVIRTYTKQLLEGLEYLHNDRIIHQDIKGANILVDNKGCIKLADFGASRKVVELATINGAKSMKGTPHWMSPEVILQTGYTTSADIWSVACTVIEMATGKPPWSQ